jgi:hypothetical protein
MSIKNMLTGLINFAGPTGLKAQKLAPEIFLIAGVVGIVTSTVMACLATRKVDAIVVEHKEEVDRIHRIIDNENERKDLAMVYIKTGGAFLKAYGPAIGLLALSLTGIVKGHNIMKGRNLALMAAYKGIQEAFEAYRKRVVEEHGKQTDFMYKNGLRQVEITTPAHVDENGKKVKEEKHTSIVSDINGVSAYARYFEPEYTDENGIHHGCSQWSPAKDYNYFFLIATQRHFNDILTARGHVFLNEVYDALGLERTEAGSIVGWVKNGKGDNFIDFGAFDPDTNTYLPLVTSDNGCVLLDFNVDGVIYADFTNVKV